MDITRLQHGCRPYRYVLRGHRHFNGDFNDVVAAGSIVAHCFTEPRESYQASRKEDPECVRISNTVHPWDQVECSLQTDEQGNGQP